VVVQIPAERGPTAPTDLTLVARDCRYAPEGAVVGPRASLQVENHDSLVHTFHLRRADGSSIQNLAVPPDGTLTWTLPNRGTVFVESDQLDWMRATIEIVDGTAWAVTDAEGRFALDGMQGGTYLVELSHPAFGSDARTVVVPPDGPTALYVDYD
jgi:hypothetical protein